MKILEKSKIVDINQIKNWEQNPRAIKKEDFERLKNQIKEHGMYKPLLCVQDNGSYVVLGGNMRLRAINELEHKQAWITLIKTANEKEKIKIALSDNDSVGYYDEQELAEQLHPHKNEIWKDYKVNLETPKFDLNGFIKAQFEDEIASDKEKEVDENIETDHECPKCGHKFS